MSLDIEPRVSVVRIGVMDASAGPEQAIFVAPCRCRIIGISLVDNTAKTAHADNKVITTVYNKGAAGDGTTVVASRTGDTPTTDDIAAFVPWPLDLSTTIANLELPAGRVLTAKVTEAGTAASGDLVDAVWVVTYAEGYGGGI